jgi:hypothetical protein
MILAIFVLVILSAMGGALLFNTQLEVKMSQSDVASKQAFYLAEAAEESARESLFVINGLDTLTDDLQDAAGDDGKIDFDLDTLMPVYGPGGNVTNFTGYGDDVPLQALTNLGDGVFIAFLTNDPVEGVTNTSDANRLVTITGVGAGPNGAIEVVQAVVEPDQPLPEMPGAAITLLGPDPLFWGGTGNASEYTGEDCDGAGVPGLTVPIVGTVGEGAERDAITGISDKNGPDYISGDLEGAETVADLTNPNDPAVMAANLGTISTDWTSCPNLSKLVRELRQKANWRCEDQGSETLVFDGSSERLLNDNKCDLPDGTAAGDILFVDGDVVVDKASAGGGILIATGTVTITGQTNWAGAILAVGDGKVIRNGAGNGEVSGGIIVADIAGADGIFGTDDDCASGSGFGSAVYEVEGGGTGNTTFCTTDLNAANPPEPYNIIAFKQE